MLEIQDVSFAYKKGPDVLKQVSLRISKGEYLIVAGRNGSGKTTVTKLIMGLLRPKTGRILLNGADIAEMTTADISRHVGYVFQNPDRQIFRDTVRQEVAYGPEQLGFSPEVAIAAVDKALAQTGLTGFERHYPRLMPKGLKQRVAIASALAMGPEMLILDEPTSGQDPLQRRALIDLLEELNRGGTTILLVTHDMEVAVANNRRNVVFAAGEKVFDGSAQELFGGEHPIEHWGLRQPTAVKLSRGLADTGFPVCYSNGQLLQVLTARIGGEGNVQ